MSDRLKRRKLENQRSNRKKVICLRCDKVLNADNAKHHQAAKHEGLASSFREISERGQTLLNFSKVVAGQRPPQQDDEMCLRSSAGCTEQEHFRDLQDDMQSPMEEEEENLQSEHPQTDSDKSTVSTENTVSSGSNITNNLLVAPKDVAMKDSTHSCEQQIHELHSILESDLEKISTSSKFTPQQYSSVDELSPSAPSSDHVESRSESYFKCLGQFRNCSKKIIDLVSCGTNGSVIHYESAFTEITEVCKEMLTTIQQTQDLAEIQLQEIASIPDELPGFHTSHDISVEHDPGRRPEKLTDGQVNYLTCIGPCQPKLSAYPKNTDLAKKGKQCSFSPVWYKDYPYLEYSISGDKAYCYVCSLFQRGLGREKGESAWITVIDDWSKMKGSRGKNKMGKLETHFSSAAHSSALHDYLHFVCNDKHVDKLLTKEQRERMVEFENKRIKNREVVEILFDVVLVLKRNGLALCGCESSDNYGDGNFCEIVHLISRHNPVMKSWLANRSARKYQTTYMSPRSQNEFITLLGEEIREKISEKVKRSEYCSVMADTTPDVSHVDELSVPVRFVDVDSLKPEEHLVYVKETYDKTGEGQAKDIVLSLKSADIPLSTIQFQTYDSTSSMPGVYNGAQQKFSEILERKVPYIKCIPHGVNLVIEHGCQESSLVGKIFQTLENIFVFFTKSTKRNKELKDKLEEIENALMLRNLSKTRWAARAESVKAVWRSLDAILDVLVSLESSKDGEAKIKASSLLNSIRNIDFICGLMLLKNVMFKTKMLSDYLQGETVDVAGALVAMSSTD